MKVNSQLILLLAIMLISTVNANEADSAVEATAAVAGAYSEDAYGDDDRLKCFTNESVEQKLSDTYVDVTCFSDTIIQVTNQEQLSGLFSSDGKQILPVKYYLENLENGLYKVQGDAPKGYSASYFFGLINDKGKFVVPYEYSAMEIMGDHFEVQKDNTQDSDECACSSSMNVGLIDAHNNEVLPIKYPGIRYLQEGMFSVQADTDDINDKEALFNANTKKFVTSHKYDFISQFNNGMAKTTVGKSDFAKYGVLNTQGKEVTAIEYSEMGFYKDLFIAQKNNKWGVLRGKKVIIPFEYENAGRSDIKESDETVGISYKPEETSFWFIEKDNKRFRLQANGQLTPYQPQTTFENCAAMSFKKDFFTQYQYDNVECVAPDKVLVTKEGWTAKQGVFTTHGKSILPFEYSFEWLSPEKTHLSYAIEGGKYGVMSRDFNKITEPVYTRIINITEGLITIEKDSRFGFLNTQGQEIIKPIYDDVGEVYEGLISVSVDGNYGFINTQGKTVIPPKYESIHDNFKNGKATVVDMNGKMLIIDKKGNVIRDITDEIL